MLKRNRLIFICILPFFLAHSLYAGTVSSAFLERAEAYYSAGRYLEALSFYQDCLDNSPSAAQTAAASFGLGLLFDRYLDDPAQALSYYKKHIELKGEHSAEALHYSSRVLVRQSNLDEARLSYQQLLQENVAYSVAYAVQQEYEKFMRGAGRKNGPFDRGILKSLSGTVRVLIEDSSDPVTIKGMPESYDALSLPENIFTPYDNVLVFQADNSSLFVNNVLWPYESLALRGCGEEYLEVNSRRYRSRVSVRAEKGRVQVINHVPLDYYLYGVLPREVYVSWPMAALQAQAVAARTYVLYHMLVNKNRSYDVLSTTSSQVYGGFDREHPATNKAVDTTHSQVLFIDGQLALALYHANSGGVVESVEDVWSAHLSHLRRVIDTPSLNGRHASWSYALSDSEVVQRLSDYGILLNDLDGVEVVKRSASGRVQLVALKGQGVSLLVGGNTLRLMIGPSVIKSTRFLLEYSHGKYAFTGTGYGHGVGMSQWGAYVMAKQGTDYAAILAHYYPGTKLASWPADALSMPKSRDDAL